MLSDELVNKTHKGVCITVHGTKSLCKILAKAIKLYLHHIQKDEPPQKLSLKDLNKQNQTLKALDLKKNDINGLQKELRLYGVSYAIKRDVSNKNCYKVYFKAKDTVQIKNALTDYTAKKFQKSSIKEKMKGAIEKAAKQILENDKSKVHSIGGR